MADAWRLARDRGVSVTDNADYLQEFDHLTLVRLLLARQRANPDHGRGVRAGGRAGSLLEVGVLLALVHEVRGRRSDALECLARAFAEASDPESYVRLFLDEGTPMAALLRAAARHGIAGHHP